MKKELTYEENQESILNFVKDVIEDYTKHNSNKKFDVDNIINAEKETLLFVAARDGGIAAVEHLLHLGADVSKPSGQKKRTPLYIAAKKGHREVFEILLLGRRTRGDLRSASQVLRGEHHKSRKFEATSLLYRAAERGYFDVCRTILDNGGAIGIDRPKSQGVTPLMIAARNGSHDCVKVLLKYVFFLCYFVSSPYPHRNVLQLLLKTDTEPTRTVLHTDVHLCTKQHLRDSLIFVSYY